MLAKSFRILTRKVTSKNLFKTQRRMFSDEDDKTNLKEIKIPEIKKEELKQQRLAQATIFKLLDPLNDHMPEEIKRAKEEIKALQDESRNLSKVTTDLENLAKVNEKNQQNLKTLIDKLKLAEEESEKIHERLTKKIEQGKTYAIQSFAKDCLEILDNFDRCFENTKQKKEQNLQDNDLYQGVELIYKSTLNIFSRYKIKPMEDPVGQKVDFNKHEVVFVTPNPNLEHNEVIYVSQKGYEIDGRVLREAKVGVVKND